ncbi:Flp family type IVb pilin [Noviherbaspirillum pedocola]|uniref:Flp family type IVb pilin n=1 Tax=Noviherbaspirillum pedocola TaxID=2801341 RepID=A0A934W6R1_9BURK|nr:Flp family type IVb pilin [Noviherbaspirillum pedocola]MBK4733809.1 Flp family type IVb pilin [Noviherbaspirillum pedocola]
MEMIKNFIREEDGVTAVEYGLIAALIAVVIAGAVQAVGTNLNAVFGSVRDCLSSSHTC